MATLCLLDDEGRTAQQWEIGDQPVAVGRGASVDVQIHDDGLSRRHFMILRQGEDYLIKDLSSRNGTWVDGSRALTAKLSHDDRILAGRSQFRFSANGASPATSGRPATGPQDTQVLPAAHELQWAVSEVAGSA